MVAITEQFNGRRGVISQTLQAVSEVLDSFTRARVSALETEFLLSLSDEALEARGLTRETLASHIAARYFDI